MKDKFNFIRGIINMFATITMKKEKVNIVSQIKPEWQELCEECSSAAKKHGLTKEKSRKLLKEIREKHNL